MEDISIRELTEKVRKISDKFEKNTSETKRLYLLKNIMAFNEISSRIPLCCGTFGTGYPFYALDTEFKGSLPIIEEQLRYNKELAKKGREVKRAIWKCSGCIKSRFSEMPDLKQICKPCPAMPNEVKPRKVINRLPDMDLWFICEDGKTKEAELRLGRMLKKAGMCPSDIDPVETIATVEEIANDLDAGKMPEKFLPIDAHIIEYSKLKSIIESVPEALKESKQNKTSPYVPIHPRSLRKQWQYDDEAYNHVYDFLAAFQEFGVSEDLQSSILKTRKEVALSYTDKELMEFMLSAASKNSRDRFQNSKLKLLFYDKMSKWRQIDIKQTGFKKVVGEELWSK